MAQSSVPENCAGIGGDAGEVNGSITFNGGESCVNGGVGGAGIGTGACVSETNHLSATGAGAITVNRGSVQGMSMANGAGIGGGYHADAPDIYINGGSVSAYPSGKDAAGIGGGAGGQCGVISITGGSISAIPSGEYDDQYQRFLSYAAALGNGYGCQNIDYSKISISISGGFSTCPSCYGSGILCSASEDPDDVPEGVIYIAPRMKIEAIDNNPDGSLAFKANLMNPDEAILHHQIYLDECKHLEGIYDFSSEGHKLVNCPDCRLVESEYTQHSPDENGVCPVCSYGTQALVRSATMLFSGDLALRFTFEFSDALLNDEGAYIRIITEKNGDEKAKYFIKDAATTDGKTVIVYPVLITALNERLNFQVVDGSGNTIPVYWLYEHETDRTARAEFVCNPAAVYSPGIYSNHMWNFETSQAMDDFAHAFYNYCASASNALGIGSRGYPEDSVKDISVSDLDEFAPKYVNTRPDGIERVSIRMYFEQSHTLRVTYYFKEGENPNDYVFTIDGEVVRAMKTSENGYAIEIPSIGAPNLGYDYVFGIAKKGGETYSITACGLTYGWACAHSSSDESDDYVILGKAMYKYYIKSLAYLVGND